MRNSFQPLWKYVTINNRHGLQRSSPSWHVSHNNRHCHITCDSYNTRNHSHHTIHYDNLGGKKSPTHDSWFSTWLTSVGWRQVCFFLHLFSKFDPQLHSSLQLIQGLASAGSTTWRGHWWKSTLVEINHFVNIQNLLVFQHIRNK